MATYIPTESFDVLVNPGMGFCTFHSFNDDPVNKGCPRGSIAYFRLFWDEYEPEEGRISYDVIDAMLQRAKKTGLPRSALPMKTAAPTSGMASAVARSIPRVRQADAVRA